MLDGGLDGVYSVDPGDDSAAGTTYSFRVSAVGYASTVLTHVVVGVQWGCPGPWSVAESVLTVALTPLAVDAGGCDAGCESACEADPTCIAACGC